MAKAETKNKQNPKLVQTVLKDGRASLFQTYERTDVLMY